MIYQFEHFGTSDHFRKDISINYSCPCHLHQSFELLIGLSGCLEVKVDSNNYTLYENEAILIFPHQLHSVKSEINRHMVIIFSPEIIKAYSSKIANTVPRNNKFNPSTHLIHSLKNLVKESSIIKKKGLLYCLCDEFDAGAEYISKSNGDKNLLYRIFDFVEHNHNKDCSLETLAKETAFSYSYLSRYFKNTVGISFNSYVNRIRINNSCYMLSNSDISITQCALDSGYGTLRSFNRNFREIMGITPVEYRCSLLRAE